MSDLRDKLNNLKARYEYAQSRVVTDKKTYKKALKANINARRAQELAQEVAERVQHDAHEFVANIVTDCLATVFGPDAYRLRIDTKKARGKTEAELVLVRDGVETDDALSSVGGGVVDVVSFALRAAAVILSSPAKRKLLVLDEPFKHLAADKTEAVAQMLKDIVEELGVQIIMVTHSQELEIGKVIDIKEVIK